MFSKTLKICNWATRKELAIFVEDILCLLRLAVIRAKVHSPQISMDFISIEHLAPGGLARRGGDLLATGVAVSDGMAARSGVRTRML
jgi:hypothetical protein